MLKFIKYLFNQYKTDGKDAYVNPYDENGNYINPKFSKLSDDELMISAEKALIMHSKAIEEVRIKARKQVFQLIHTAINSGKTQVRLEPYSVRPEVLVYLDSLGYRVE